MKNAIILMIVFLFVSLPAFSEVSLLTDESIAFYYESRAEIPASDQTIAKIMSIDYRNAKDEFTRYDLLKKIKPVIDKRFKQARSEKIVVINVGSRLGDYDFEKKAFPTSISGSTFIPYKNGYAATFLNAKEIQFLPVPMEDAKKYAHYLQKSRSATISITGEIISAKENNLNYRDKKTLQIKIIKMSIKLNKGPEIGSIVI